MARKVMVMDIDDQFAFADRVADILQSFGIDLHMALADALGVQSYSLAMADPHAKLTQEQKELAWAEENAVLHVQRWMRMAGVTNG